MTNEELTRLEELVAAATPGPWEATRSDPAEGVDVWWLTTQGRGNFEVDLGSMQGGWPHERKEANARLVAAARTAIPALITALETERHCSASALAAVEGWQGRATRAEAEVERLKADMAKLRAAFRVNAMRWQPGMSHTEIDAEIARALEAKHEA